MFIVNCWDLSVKDEFCGHHGNTVLPLKHDNCSDYNISWSQSVHYLEVPCTVNEPTQLWGVPYLCNYDHVWVANVPPASRLSIYSQ